MTGDENLNCIGTVLKRQCLQFTNCNKINVPVSNPYHDASDFQMFIVKWITGYSHNVPTTSRHSQRYHVLQVQTRRR